MIINTSSVPQSESRTELVGTKRKPVISIPQEILDKYYGPQNLILFASQKSELQCISCLNELMKRAYQAIFNDFPDFPSFLLDGSINPSQKSLIIALEDSLSQMKF